MYSKLPQQKTQLVAVGGFGQLFFIASIIRYNVKIVNSRPVELVEIEGFHYAELSFAGQKGQVLGSPLHQTK